MLGFTWTHPRDRFTDPRLRGKPRSPGSGPEGSGAEDRSHEPRQVVVAGDQVVVHVVRLAGLEQQQGDRGENKGGEGADHGDATAMGPERWW
jgi:hypothetical protein